MRILIFLAGLLLASLAQADAARVDTGTLDGAHYRIDVPAQWNRGLVVYFHGYSIGDVRFDAGRPLPDSLGKLVERGYAVAQSGYSRSGWAVEQAVADSERLRRFFVKRHGKPTRTLAMGASMGGLLTVHAVETMPQVYAGGLALCGALGAAGDLVQHAFDVRAAFDAYFPDLLGPLVPVPADYMPDRLVGERIAEALRSNPTAAAALRSLQPGSTDDNLPDVIAFLGYVVKEVQQRTGANPFDNRDFAYVGTGDDANLNARVRRYSGDAAAMPYLARWYTPSGKLERPVLALHTLADPLVPVSWPNGYALRTRTAGRGANFVQQWVEREGHCTLRADEIAGAFDDLVGWIGGQRPPSGSRR
ncbi:MAG TPA: alpha/beta hydrolase [Dokdonella sp.]|uniref:alpha/beta hydrolase n=1 Tax=Dokdonella sp. TaxID=2291710 RepID=UPI0025BD5AEA|nr:alpha/beta hydrolase [Dokdonella sp.]MBX3691793.1 alpha/beta hydrolase [Dokdonella sp.]MCW5569166.1 alpha/beta hydrolase [Dokdonella sp.]HNR90794.1 alpha/beta hydrolase [Dokdonella sp.]